jgi:hypothetical protein
VALRLPLVQLQYEFLCKSVKYGARNLFPSFLQGFLAGRAGAERSTTLRSAPVTMLCLLFIQEWYLIIISGFIGLPDWQQTYFP